MDFPEYAIKYSEQALEAKRALPPELLVAADDIVSNTLARDPVTPRKEIRPASPDGKTSFIYVNRFPHIEITFGVDVEKKILFLFHFVAPTFSGKKLLFISYSHKDRQWLDTLKTRLTALVQEGVIDFWVDQDLEKGLKWRPQIEKALEECNGGVLLVSPDFLQSAFIKGVELPALCTQAKNTRNKRILWIHLRKCDLNNGDLQAIMQYQSLLDDPAKPFSEYNDEERNAAYTRIVEGIRGAVMN